MTRPMNIALSVCSSARRQGLRRGERGEAPVADGQADTLKIMELTQRIEAARRRLQTIDTAEARTQLSAAEAAYKDYLLTLNGVGCGGARGV